MTRIISCIRAVNITSLKMHKGLVNATLGEGDRFGDGHGLGRDMGCMRKMADELREGHTLLKTGLSAHRHAQRQTHKSENSISASETFTWRV